MVGETAGVGVLLADVPPGPGHKQPVENIGRFVERGRDCLRCEGSEPVRDIDRLSRGLTYGLQVIDGLHRAGVEFRSLAEDFDTATSTGKLQLSMVPTFSECWRNSVRDCSAAGQAKARAEGRFPGRQPSLTEQQREYIRVEPLRGVSQRELAKQLDVNRWTIQQVDG